MTRTSQTLRALAMMGLMGGAMYALAGCGGTVSSTVPVSEQTDTSVPFGQRLYVANQTTNGTASVLRFDSVLEQVNAATLSPDAQFTGFNTLGQINSDFAGDLLAADSGANLVDDFANAEVQTGVVQTTPSVALSVAVPSGVAFDSSHNFFYVTSGSTIEQFSNTGTAGGTLTDSSVPDPKLLAIDDLNTLSTAQSTGVLFVAGTTSTGGIISIITEPQNLVGQGDISGNANVAHITSISGINLVDPTGIAYDSTHEQLWVTDPGAGFVFIIDNAPNITESDVTADTVLGAALQIQATSIAVDFSTGVAALMTLNSASSANTVNIYSTTDQLGASEGELLNSQLPTPSTIVLNGVTTPVSMEDDSSH